MKRQSGFSLIELVTVLGVLLILTVTTLFTFTSYNRQTKTEQAASAIFGLMRQARIQAINTRQYCAIVINTSNSDIPAMRLQVGGTPLSFLSHSVSLVSMGTLAVNDEVLRQTNKFPIDIIINQASGGPLAPNTDVAFNLPERNFSAFDPATMAGLFVLFFDPAGRAVDAPSNTGNFIYSRLYLSSFDIDRASSTSAPLVRALTIYGASGGVKYWRYIPGANMWQAQIN